MAKCEICGHEMSTADGCSIGKVHIDGKVYKRSKVGDSRFEADLSKGERCHDCGATYGHFHHWGCDVERCPVCGDQLISCSCEDVFVETGER